MYRYLRKIRAMQANDLPFSALILLEIAVILVGVMLALLANEWRESRAIADSTQKALRSLASEMQHNHIQVVRTYTYYRSTLQQIDALKNIRSEEVTIGYGYELENWKGMALPMLRSSTYDMTVSTGVIKDIDFETADSLALIYNVQSVIEQLDRALLARSVTDPDITKLDSVQYMFTLYNELFPSLIGVYQQLGKPILQKHGYTATLDDEELAELVERHMQVFLNDQIVEHE